MFESRIFPVTTDALLADCDVTLARLAEESDSRAEALRKAVGVDLPTLRDVFAKLVEELRELKRRESATISEVVAQSGAGDPGPARAWLAEVRRAAEAYVVSRCTDDLALAGRLRLGKQDPDSLSNLRAELTILVPEASSLRDRLRDAGFSDAFVSQGWAALEAAGGKRLDSVDDLIRLEDSNRQCRKVEARVAALRTALAAAEDFLLAGDIRTPRKYALDDLTAVARRARARLVQTAAQKS